MPGQLFVIPVTGGQPEEALNTEAGFEGARWVNSSHVLYERQSADFKKRTIFVADVSSGKSHPIHEDVEDQFWSIPRAIPDPPRNPPPMAAGSR